MFEEKGYLSDGQNKTVVHVLVSLGVAGRGLRNAYRGGVHDMRACVGVLCLWQGWGGLRTNGYPHALKV